MAPRKSDLNQPPLWWQTRWFIFVAMAATVVPLLWPPIPPLTDLLGHIGSYRVQLDGAADPHLRNWYEFHWALMGNLGVELLIVPLSKLFGIELGVKLIVMAIVAITVAALLLIAREVHGRVPATALFALPLAYNFPLHFGFVNFALAMALALLALVGWLRLGRSGHLLLRSALFVPISCGIWICHAYGWGFLGILAFSTELARQRDGGTRWPAAVVRSAAQCLSLCVPILLMVAWRSGAVAGGTGDWFNWPVKLLWLMAVLQDRWSLFDLLCAGLLYLVVFAALPAARERFAPSLGVAALLLTLIFAVMPRILFGSAYADMRLAPYALAIALIALRPIDSERIRSMVAWGALAFCLARLVGTTASLALYDARYQRELGALNHIPVGARIASFVGFPCGGTWYSSRLLHLPSIAIERRRAFTNDQWSLAGAQLLSVRYEAAAPFMIDPSEAVVADDCPAGFWQISRAIEAVPRSAFDYVWLIDPPAYRPEATHGLTPIWRYRTSVLFRINHLDDRPR